MILRAACTCHHGRVRENNEDNLYFNGEILPLIHVEAEKTMTLEQNMDGKFCFGVFDGMGGEQNGEEASYLAAQVCMERVVGWNRSCESEKDMKPADGLWVEIQDPADELLEILQEANLRICGRTREKKLRRMGSTAAMLLFDKDKVWICNIGDSRIYRLRGRELIQCSVDHTDRLLVESQGGRRKPYLTQHLGIFPDEMKIEPYCVSREVQGGDTYLICSDGLTDMLSDKEIGEILLESRKGVAEGKKERRSGKGSAETADLARTVEQLRDAALTNGGRDNVTVQVIQIEAGELKKENKFRRIFFRRK